MDPPNFMTSASLSSTSLFQQKTSHPMSSTSRIRSSHPISSTSLLGIRCGGVIMLAADSRITDAYTKRVMSNEYVKPIRLHGGMFIAFSGSVQSSENIVHTLKKELGFLRSDEEKTNFIKTLVQRLIQSFVTYDSESWRQVMAIVGGFWTNPSKSELFRIPHTGPVEISNICVAGSCSGFMGGLGSLRLDLHHSVIEATLVDIMLGGIVRDLPTSGGLLRVLIISSDGTVEEHVYAPDNFNNPTEYKYNSSRQLT